MSDCRVLVVDDDLMLLRTVSEILEFDGHHVTTASNGREALDAIAVNGHKLVLLDMRMPVMNGWEFADALRQQGVMLPIVVMTAAQDAAAWAEEIGATAYLEKPFDFDRLLETVVTICREN